MGGLGIGHWIVLGVIAILLLGGGRFSNMMGDVAKGIKNFKKGMTEEEDAPPSRLEGKTAPDPAPHTAADREAERTREER